MADLNKLFPGFESFMDGDIEINNEVTVPESGDDTANDAADAMVDEVESEDIGTEGAEIEGESDKGAAEAETTNMMFDQLLMMYRHVKRFGIDRTFLSLYNDKGQLSSMIGYRFPSCESIDSVGSPRSQMSAKFIAAMEDEQEGVFKRLLSWIVGKFKQIAGLIKRFIAWIKDKFVNTGKRIEKIKKLLESREMLPEDKLPEKEITDCVALIKVAASSARLTLQNLVEKAATQAKNTRLGLSNGSITADEATNVAAKIDEAIKTLQAELDSNDKTAKVSAIYHGTDMNSIPGLKNTVQKLETAYKQFATVNRSLDELYKTYGNVDEATALPIINKNLEGLADDPDMANKVRDITLTLIRLVNACIRGTRMCDGVIGKAIGALLVYVTNATTAKAKAAAQPAAQPAP